MNWQALSAVASLVSAVAVLALAVAAVVVGLELRAAERRLLALADRVQNELSPVLQNVRDISANVRAMSDAVRNDVGRVNDTVTAVTERVQHALVVSEQRLGEFNALLAVVQDEAEQLFVSTASTVRGVQGGAAAFRGRGGTDLASDELDAAEEADATMNQEEEDNGYDSNSESATPALPPAPRVRPRHGRQRRA
jgi:hypothetical protein